MADKNKVKDYRRARIKNRVRKKVSGTNDRPRLAVFRSTRNIYAQLIDDSNRKTLAAVSTLSPALKTDLSATKSKIEAAKIIGKEIAAKAKELKIDTVVFDRGVYLYHGRIKAVAEGARENGLTF